MPGQYKDGLELKKKEPSTILAKNVNALVGSREVRTSENCAVLTPASREDNAIGLSAPGQ